LHATAKRVNMAIVLNGGLHMKLTPTFALCIALTGFAGLQISALAASQPGTASGAPAITKSVGQFSFEGYVATVPTDWIALKPSSSMRVAQYRVPANGRAGDAELVVFYFGMAQGGSVEANIDRWVTQFSSLDGQPVVPKIDHLRLGGLRATTVELHGTYARGVGTGPQGAAKADQTLLVAIIETPAGNLTFQLHGDRITVEAHRKSFETMIRSFGKIA
jgi:hypothetical protein